MRSVGFVVVVGGLWDKIKQFVGRSLYFYRKSGGGYGVGNWTRMRAGAKLCYVKYTFVGVIWKKDVVKLDLGREGAYH